MSICYIEYLGATVVVVFIGLDGCGVMLVTVSR